MAENDGSGGAAANGGEGGAAAAANGGGAPPARPDWAPEKFWDAEKGALKTEDLAKSYTEISTRFAKGKDGIREAVAAELNAERLKDRPEKPDAYKVAVPKEGPLAERVTKAGMVILDKAPAADFKPEQGKKYFVMDQNNPLLAQWRQIAHANGLSNDVFNEGVIAFAEAELAKQPTSEKLAELRAAEYAKLGEHGEQRAQHAYGRLKGLLGEEKAKALQAVLFDANTTLAVEALLEKAGEPKFTPGTGGSDAMAGDPAALKAEAKKLQGEHDYWQDKTKQARVAEIFKKLYPGQRQTAALNPTSARA